MCQKAFTTVFGKLFNPRRNEARPQLCQNHMVSAQLRNQPTPGTSCGGGGIGSSYLWGISCACLARMALARASIFSASSCRLSTRNMRA